MDSNGKTKLFNSTGAVKRVYFQKRVLLFNPRCKYCLMYVSKQPMYIQDHVFKAKIKWLNGCLRTECETNRAIQTVGLMKSSSNE